MISTRDRVDYWKRWVGLGSEWLTVDFESEVVVVTNIEYSKDLKSVVVEYTHSGYPGFTEVLPTSQFTDGRFIRNT